MRLGPLLAAVFLGYGSPAQAYEFGSERTILPHWEGWSASVADFDGDGDEDILWGSRGEVMLSRNEHPRPGAWRLLSVATLDPETAAYEQWTHDIDGDGDLDVLAAERTDDRGGRRIAWYENPGEGPWPVHVVEPSGVLLDVWGEEPNLLVEVDGRLEVRSGPLGAPTVNDHGPALGAEAADVGDTDGDGDVDVVIRITVIEGATSVRVLQHLTLEAGSAPAVQTLERYSAGAPRLFDLDDDGDLDILYGALYFANDPSLPSGWAGRTDAPCGLFRGTLADFDDDGDIDRFGRVSTDEVGLCRNGGDGTWTLETSPGRGSSSFEAIDHDGDGVDEALIFGNGVLIAPTEGAAESRTPSLVLAAKNTDLRLIDVDGDGRIDVFVGHGDTGIVHHRNSEDGWTAYALPPFAGDALAVPGDFDGDGDIDIGFAHESGPGWWERVGEDWMRHDLSPGDRWDLFGLTSGDVDGDGDPDLLLSSVGAGLRWYDDDGWGRVEIAPAGDGTCELLDMDGDGDGDFACETGWFERSGGDWVRHEVPELLSYESLLPADWDGDGVGDWIGRTYERGFPAGWRVNLLTRQGGGGTSVRGIASFDDVPRLQRLDFDGGGEPDLGMRRGILEWNNMLRGWERGWYRNDAGVFTVAAFPEPGDGMEAVGDIDGDGSLDWVAAPILYNTHRILWRAYEPCPDPPGDDDDAVDDDDDAVDDDDDPPPPRPTEGDCAGCAQSSPAALAGLLVVGARRRVRLTRR